MQMITRGVIALTLAAAIVVPAGAQQLATAPIDSGIIVRMNLSRQESVRGRLLRKFLPSDTALTFCRYPATPCANLSDPHVQTLPATQVTHLDVADGTHVIEGAALGALIGGAVAALFIGTLGRLCEEDCGADYRRMTLGMVGFGIGLGVAFGSQSVGWRRAP